MKRILLLAVMAILPFAMHAEVRLPSVLGSNMVLQRNTEVNLWGTADAGKTVTVETSWNGAKYKVKADSEGAWSLKVVTGEAGGPYTITFSDGRKTVLDNILLGEVWICGGQSNMEMPVCGFMNQPVENCAEFVMNAGQYPGIRMFTVARNSTSEPQTDCKGEWLCSTPASVSTFSATAYFFGLTLYKMLGVPVGLLTSNWGGSTIETWMSKEAVDAIEGIDHKLISEWKGEASEPGLLYNGMILPIKDYTAKGFIWYQGCSNRKNWFDYKELQKGLINLWRKDWGNDKMPFYITQLAPYRYEGDNLRSLPLVIEAQYQAAAELENVAVAATTDLGHPTCIHPAKKLQVGQRLAYLALARDYKVAGVPKACPTYKSMEKDGSTLILSFNNLSEPNHFNDPDSFVGFGPDTTLRMAGFEIAGEDGVFHPATVRMKWWQNKIMVSSEQVPEPVAVRYAFKNYCPEANVRTNYDLPLAPFRTDNWEIPAEEIGEIR
ncbi:MAG: sialate O-acetylesterase [Bacteroidales bacterium]|nr:sialate O-acetylesterase [Bacteroidales bacterium]